MKKTLSATLIFLATSFFACSGSYAQKAEPIVKLTTDNYDKEISEGIVLVDFWATWCPPCRKMNPILEELAKEYSGKIKIGKFDVDTDKQFSTKKGIQAIPTMIFYFDGKELGRIRGASEKDDLKKVIDDLLSNYSSLSNQNSDKE